MNRKENFPSPEETEKQRRWGETAERIERMVDRLGKHIDEGIKEGVIALNAFDINTTGSCEGHIDSGTYSPWIDIGVYPPKETLELYKDREKNREKLKEISNEMERKSLEQQRKILPHLDDFYKGRDVSSGRRLVLSNVALGRLESQGARFQEIEDDVTKQERLREYQDEMDAFSAFMKEKYFE